MSEPQVVKADTLRQLQTLKEFEREQLETLARQLDVSVARPGTKLITRGSDDNFTFYLLEGSVVMEAEDGRRRELSAQDESARSPLAQLRPRRFDVLAVTPVRYLRIDNRLVEELQQLPHGDNNYTVEALDSEEEVLEDQLSYDLIQDLRDDRLLLPSLPDVAVRVGRAITDEKSDAHTIARIIQSDPAITAKVIKAANSAVYGGMKAVDTCAGAVVRLGTDVSHKLVLSFALRELFRTSSSQLQNRMRELLRHSTQVGALAFVLAKRDARFDPEQALLAGLVHDIGVVAILNYAQNYPDVIEDGRLLDAAVGRLRGQIGSMILRKWGFSADFVVTALEAEDWERDRRPEPDYCDIVIIAQLHSFVGTDRLKGIPPIDQLPAYRKLDLGELTPEKSILYLKLAAKQIASAESLISG